MSRSLSDAGGFDESSARDAVNKANNGLIVVLAIASLFVLIYGLSAKNNKYITISTALVWAASSGLIGGLFGLLFGVPKAVERARPATAAGNADDANAAPLDTGSTYLTDLVDWLTKSVVAAGLINLGPLRIYYGQQAQRLAAGLNSGWAESDLAIAFAIISAFLVGGFLLGYLNTRLFLAPAFALADAAHARRVVESAIRDAPQSRDEEVKDGVPSEGPGEPTKQQLVTAARVAALSGQKTGDVAARMSDLAKEYERVRVSMVPGWNRTREMGRVVDRMRALALAAYARLGDLAKSDSAGERLAAIVMLQMKPDPANLDWLAQRVKEETPFVGNQAAIALLCAVRVLGATNREPLDAALRSALAALPDKRTDRRDTLEKALEELSPDERISSPN